MKTQFEFLLDVSKLITKIQELGFTATGGELFRTTEQQQIYMDTGRSKTMKSMHLLRLAIDLNIFKNDQMVGDVNVLKPIGDYWQSLNPKNKWGGYFLNFIDSPHFQRDL